jgi:hypothetical protein
MLLSLLPVWQPDRQFWRPAATLGLPPWCLTDQALHYNPKRQDSSKKQDDDDIGGFTWRGHLCYWFLGSLLYIALEYFYALR